jgi:hypothetical protein
MPSGIVKNGVILRVLGGTMRKFKTCSPRSLPFRLLVILAGALLLLAAFAPRANAFNGLIRFYDFEPPNGPYGVGLQSDPPALETGPGFDCFLLQNDGSPFPLLNTARSPGPPIHLNEPPGVTSTESLVIVRSGTTNLNIVMPFNSATGIYDITSVSFASAGSGNGYQNVQLQMSIDNGVNWTNLSVNTTIPTSITVVTLNVTNGTTLGNPTLLVRMHFTNGQSNGNDTQNVIDNIQVNGTVVPEPATVAGGLLGVLGLCWFQRRRLIQSVRFRRT